MFTESASARGL